jgi:simple sugar transport system ATP-binding protein
MELFLGIKNLTKRFPQVLACDSISFDVRKGEIHCLLGENGAGKTTLAECLYGTYKPDFGEIFVKGSQVTLSSPSDAIQHGIGMVHQHFVLVPPLSVIENIVVGTQTKGILLNLDTVEKHLQSLCEGYGITLDLWEKVWQLSVGEQQWIEILKALYIGAELLILDEPTAVLTPQEIDKLFTILKKMRADGLSILFITHKLREVMAVSDRVTVLRKGKHVATVNTSEVTTEDLARLMVGREVVLHVHKEKLTPGKPLLEIRGLQAQNDKGQKALQEIDLTLNENEILGIAGVSGNGQKELCEVLVGVRKASDGKILMKSEDITNHTPHSIMMKGIAHIPEDRFRQGLVPDFSVSENLILGQQNSNQYRGRIFLNFDAIEKFARECISAFEIVTPSLNQITKLLSGGNIQKLILARELSIHPKCIIANQPTRGLDIAGCEYVYNQLLALRKSGVGILLISEDLEEIINISDRIAVIFRGQLMGVFNAAEAKLEKLGLLMAGIQEEAL